MCPECGRAFKPGDTATYATPESRFRWPRIPGPPTIKSTMAACSVLLLYVYWSSVPGGLGASLFLGVCLLVPTGLAVLTLLCLDYAGHVTATRNDRERALGDRATASRREKWRWIVTPVCIVLITSAWLTDWPLRSRFLLSRSELTKVVDQVQRGANPLAIRGRYGLFRVSFAYKYKSGAIFLRTGSSGFDSVGFLYSPSDTPGKWKNAKRLSRNWFTEMW